MWKRREGGPAACLEGLVSHASCDTQLMPKLKIDFRVLAKFTPLTNQALACRTSARAQGMIANTPVQV